MSGPSRAVLGRGSVAGEMFAALFVGIVAAAALAFAISNAQAERAARLEREQHLADRVADLYRVLGAAPAALRPGLMGAGPEAPRWLAGAPEAAAPDAALGRRLTARLGAGAQAAAYRLEGPRCAPPPPAPPARPLAPNAADEPRPPAPPRAPPPKPPVGPPAGPAAGPPTCARVDMTLADGTRAALLLATGPRAPARPAPPLGLPALAVVAALAALLAYGAAHLATGPLRRLSRAALALGGDLDRPALRLEGPREVRQAAAAFNTMQARLQQTLAERTHMLAAITHDLRTPMTRLRLRLEKVADPGLRDQLLADHAAMDEMIRDGLDLARSAGAAEPWAELDVGSLLQALADDAAEAGFAVAVAAPAGLIVRTRPQALARCLGNLLDNALKYAGAAALSAEPLPGPAGPGLRITVSDEGPGIPPDQLDAVMQPFVRLETSRSRETGGVGLGLTIARLLADRAGGALRLENRPGGGLAATIDLRGG